MTPPPVSRRGKIIYFMIVLIFGTISVIFAGLDHEWVVTAVLAIVDGVTLYLIVTDGKDRRPRQIRKK